MLSTQNNLSCQPYTRINWYEQKKMQQNIHFNWEYHKSLKHFKSVILQHHLVKEGKGIVTILTLLKSAKATAKIKILTMDLVAGKRKSMSFKMNSYYQQSAKNMSKSILHRHMVGGGVISTHNRYLMISLAQGQHTLAHTSNIVIPT